MAKNETKTACAMDKFFAKNPHIKTIWVDSEGNIYLSYNAKPNFKKITK